jgi:hypothetical protein
MRYNRKICNKKTHPGVRCLHSCCYVCDKGCPVIEVALSEGPNRVAVLPSREDGNRSSFQNVVFLYLEFWTIDKIQKPCNSEDLLVG